MRALVHKGQGAESAGNGTAEMSLPGSGGFHEEGQHVPHQSAIEERDEQRDGYERNMSAQQSAEEEEEGQAIDDAAGPDVPPRLADEEGEQAATYPDGNEDVGGYAAIEIEEAPRQEEERQRVGHQVAEAAVDKRMGEDAEDTPPLHGVDPQATEVPIHAHLQELQEIEDQQEEERYGRGKKEFLYLRFHHFRVNLTFFAQYYELF